MANSAFDSPLGVNASSASQSEQEAATSTTTFTSPGTQQFHPSASKLWLRADFGATVSDSYNVTSISDDGTGKATVTIATDFGGATYCVAATVNTAEGSGRWATIDNTSPPAAGTFEINVYSAAGTLADGSFMYAVAFGAQ